ncbi:MAG: HAMP domain-containing protein [Bacteroidota bacterium]
MLFFKHINIKNRLSLILLLVISVLCIIAGSIIYTQQKKYIIHQVEKQIWLSVNNFSGLLAHHHEIKMNNNRKIQKSTGFLNRSQNFTDTVHSLKMDTVHDDLNFSSIAREYLKTRLIGIGTPLIVDQNGNLTTLEEKSDLDVSAFISGLPETNENKYHKMVIDGDQKASKKIFYSQYYAPLNVYSGLLIPYKTINQHTFHLRNLLIVSILLVVLLGVLIMTTVFTRVLKPLTKIGDVINKLSFGKIAEPVQYTKNDELGLIIKSINNHIKGLNETLNFSNELKKGNL